MYVYARTCTCASHIHALTYSCSLEMLDKMDVPLIVEGYPLVVAMNALLFAIKSVSLVVYDKITSRATTPPPTSPGQHVTMATHGHNLILTLPTIKHTLHVYIPTAHSDM